MDIFIYNFSFLFGPLSLGRPGLNFLDSGQPLMGFFIFQTRVPSRVEPGYPWAKYARSLLYFHLSKCLVFLF
ncbi:hypothetical protein PRUPE_5G086400 [Prunus persica]|uniref:Uncharacterized protein n=1 Tax=Prunus persica TaxID=3760 RepID=M5WB96_PRUPE|nr:hypothetical protein PRUPE_5G086400 [Prunus persica]